jgi:hypothetical protein
LVATLPATFVAGMGVGLVTLPAAGIGMGVWKFGRWLSAYWSQPFFFETAFKNERQQLRGT